MSTQHNARIHAGATALVCAVGMLIDLSRIEWCCLLLAIAAVWTAESCNTAIEFACDVASSEFHPLVAKAKDVAAAAVLITAIGACLVGAVIFFPHLAGFVNR